MNTPTPDDKAERMRADALKLFHNVDWVTQKVVNEYKATMIKQRYDALVKAGFADAIALFLCVQEWK